MSADSSSSDGRPVTLFTGQRADLPLSELAPKASRWFIPQFLDPAKFALEFVRRSDFAPSTPAFDAASQSEPSA